MANAQHVPHAGFDELPVEEQMDDLKHVPVPTWHLELLEQRRAEASADDGQPWEEFEVELRAELASRRR